MQVTGLKAKETSPLGSLSQTEPQGPQDQDVRKSRQETEDRDVLPHMEAGDVKTELKEDEDEEEAPAGLYSDWTRGSVRRVTQQLEKRMKQEHETSPLSSSPPSLSSSTSNSHRRPLSSHSSMSSTSQDASGCSQVSKVCTVHKERGKEDAESGPAKGECGHVAGMEALGNHDKSTKEHKLRPAEMRLLSTSSPFHHSPNSPFASVNFLCLEGVTELESSTEWDSPSQGPHSDIFMSETWETLCELSAFLQQVSMAGKCKAKCVGQAQKRGSSIQKRVREVEARIRQAGLTPPSLMKRSASLAKLGCLELLANDLNDWELRRSAVSSPSAQHPALAASDESKKQRVHSSPSSADVCEVTSERLPKAGETSSGASAPSNQNPQRGKPLNSGQEPPHSPGPTLLTARTQYGRTHPLRRLEKRTVSTLYHTM